MASGHFLVYIQSWWYFQPSLLKVGCTPSSFHSIYPFHSSYIGLSSPSSARLHCKKVSDFPVPSRDVANLFLQCSGIQLPVLKSIASLPFSLVYRHRCDYTAVFIFCTYLSVSLNVMTRSCLRAPPYWRECLAANILFQATLSAIFSSCLKPGHRANHRSGWKGGLLNQSV
jgi:hypothetical protein